MRKHVEPILCIAVALALSVTGAVPATASTGGQAKGDSEARRGSDGSAERKIVVLSRGTAPRAAERALERADAEQIRQLPLVNGLVVEVPDESSAKRLDAQPGVLRVEDDAPVRALGVGAGEFDPPSALEVVAAAAQPRERIPWGVSSIRANRCWRTTSGRGKKVAIIDTGIARTHPDLRANVAGGVSVVDYTNSYNDDNGHGTHVAGTAAAVNNRIGIIGVAPRARLYGVKVLDAYGTGTVSDVIAGLDWAVENDMDVVSMSLGSSQYSQAFELAVERAEAAGVVQVAAAGNEGPFADTVAYPAKFEDVVAVGATELDGDVASFSSRGPEVDLAAPGVRIRSTWRRNTYRYATGTSMAAPHVSGVVALLLTRPTGAYDADGDAAWDPDEVREKLRATAVDRGPSGPDTSFGSGFVRADRAVLR